MRRPIENQKPGFNMKEKHMVTDRLWFMSLFLAIIATSSCTSQVTLPRVVQKPHPTEKGLKRWQTDHC
jgi:hypothetical protein